MEKRCNGCEELKELSEFYRSRAAPDGLQGRCKDCFRRYRGLNRDRIYATKRAREAIFKARVIQAYGGKCTCCGESEYAFLTFDHVNDDGAEHRKSRKQYATHLARWAALNGYPKSLQLLCANCNMAKQFTPGGCPHQTKQEER
jgi:hypothetical protein